MKRRAFIKTGLMFSAFMQIPLTFKEAEVINPKYLDVHFWAKIAQDAQEQFHMCEEYLVSEDVLQAFASQFYDVGYPRHKRVKDFSCDAGCMPIRIVPNKTNFFALKTDRAVIYA